MAKRRLNGHLSKKEVETLKKALLEQKERITTKLSQEFSHYHIKKSETKDSVDEANENILVSFNTRLTNRENLYLKKVLKSLAKFEKDEYGVCEECGGEIPFGRLNARLTSELCIVCKEESEAEEMHNVYQKRSKSLGKTLSMSK